MSDTCIRRNACRAVRCPPSAPCRARWRQSGAQAQDPGLLDAGYQILARPWSGSQCVVERDRDVVLLDWPAPLEHLLRHFVGRVSVIAARAVETAAHGHNAFDCRGPAVDDEDAIALASGAVSGAVARFHSAILRPDLRAA